MAARPYGFAAAKGKVHIIARLAFYGLFLLSLTNINALINRYNELGRGVYYDLPTYPFAFGAGMLLIFLFTGKRVGSTYLLVSWGFWVLYALFGFLGPGQKTEISVYFVGETIFKPWITYVGLPWLALRTITPETLPRLCKIAVSVVAAGGFLAIVQMIWPPLMQVFVTDSGRGAGFWINPNHGGGMCVMMLMISLMCPFKSKLLNLAIRLLLIGGTAASLSRSAILCLVIAWVVYGIASKRFAAVAKTLMLAMMFVVAMYFAIEIYGHYSPISARRLGAVKAMLTGDIAAEGADNRTAVWMETFRRIVEDGGVVFGLGHGSTYRIVDVGGGLSPHNYYLYVWANSGILALLGLLVFHVMLYIEARKCSDMRTRAAMTALAVVFAVAHVFDHSVFGRPAPGTVLAIMAVVFAYGQQASRRIPAMARRAVRAPSVRPIGLGTVNVRPGLAGPRQAR